MSGFALSATWLLAMLAAVAFVSGRRPSAVGVLALAGGFVAAFGAATWFPLGIGGTGAVVAVVAGWRLIQGSARADLLLGGICAGLAAAVHGVAGLNPLVAGGIAVTTLIVGALVTGGRFLDPLFAVCAIAAPVFGFAPEVAEGWRAGQALTNAQATGVAAPVPLWAMLVLAAGLLLGVARATWIKR